MRRPLLRNGTDRTDPPSARSRLRSAAPALLVGLLGFALTLDLRVQSLAGEQDEQRRAELARIAAVRQRHTAQLEQALADLRARLDSVAARAGDETLRRLRSTADELGVATGTVALRGPGIEVRLADAADNAAMTETDVRIQDIDIQSVVNELWAAGAEAIAINGQRIISTSAIRNAGGAVLVNFKVLTSPYRIVALGDAAGLQDRFERSATAGHFRKWVQIYGLGFAVRRAATFDVPAFAGSLRVSEARVASRRGEG